MAVSRGWVFTLERTPETEAFWGKMEFDTIKYMVVGREVGKETNWNHWQGFIRFSRTYRLAGVKKLIGFDKVHCEPQKGTNEQASQYCKKEELAFEYGELEACKSGDRTDIKEFYEAVKEGVPDLELWDKHTSCMMRYGKALDRLRSDLMKADIKRWEKLQVEYVWGEPGTGKTRYVYECEADIYRVDHASGGDRVWFDGYTGQEAILFDDFRGNIRHAYMLQLLDGYPMQLQVKGGYTQKKWKRVYITSNVRPEALYEGVDDASRQAFLRRITRRLQL